MNATLTATLHTGISAEFNGQPCHLAIVDANGHIIDQGTELNREVTRMISEAHWNSLTGSGHIKVLSKPQARRAA